MANPKRQIQYGAPTYVDRIKAFLILAAFLAILTVSAALALGALYALWNMGRVMLFFLSGGTVH